MKKYVSIDIGGTAIKYGLVSEDGEILERREMETEASKGGPAILEKAIAITQRYGETEKISGICISTAGMVDVEKGEIFYAGPQIPNYGGTRFKAVMEERFSVPCEVENDVNCAGLAESVSGAAKGSSSSLTLTVGTGIGGCAVIHGQVYHGFCSSACEVGYMHMPGGSFQDLGATSVLTRKTAEKKGDPVSAWNGRRVFEQAKRGDAVCNQMIEEMADALGMGIANICYVLNPEVVVLGGGAMAQEAVLRGKIQRAIDKYLVPSMAGKLKLAFAVHRNDAGMLGAFYHFRAKHPEQWAEGPVAEQL